MSQSDKENLDRCVYDAQLFLHKAHNVEELRSKQELVIDAIAVLREGLGAA